jgi:PAS domain S-box-containing protein
MAWIARTLRRLPLTLKLVVLTLAGGLLVWKALDELQTQEISALLHDEVSQRLGEQAREDRLFFDQHRRGYVQALKLFVSQRSLVEHATREAASWSDPSAGLVRHGEPPAWLPARSLIRAFAPPRFWMLLDAGGRPREIYQMSREPLPGGLGDSMERLVTLSHSPLMMTELDGSAYLLAAAPIRGKSGAPLGFMMVGAPLDDDFLAASQRTIGADHLVVLLSEDGETVLASSRPEEVAAGSSVPLLRARFFVMGKSFFDYGDSELRIWLASLMPKGQVEALSSRLIWVDKRNRAITAAAIILTFAALMSWVTRRVDRVTSEISEFSRSRLGASAHASPPGDSLHRLREEFRSLTRAVIEARAALEHEAEEKLRVTREAADVFRDVIEKAPDALVIVRGERLLFVNPALVKSLAYPSAAALRGRRLVELVDANAREEMAKLVRAAEQGEAARPIEARFRRRDGELATLEVSPGPLVRFDGAPATLLMARDVTERKKIEETLLLADRMASVGVLAAGVAHEINNPLTYVITNLELAHTQLRLQGEALEPIAGEVAKALEGSERVRVIVRHLKTFSRADEEQLGPVDVRDVLETSIAMASNEIRHRARLTRELEPVPGVRANEGRLAQVFVNVLVNAAQALPEDGEEGEIRVRSRVEAGAVVVEVEDTGAGIPPEHLKRIFDPFFTTKPVGVGTGLGLSISHGIISGLGGTIEVRSEPGKGTSVRIALPACAEAVQRIAPQARPAAPSARARILVVDDEPDVGAALQLALDPEHEVLSLQEGRAALARLMAGDRFDLILCDLMMPGMSGTDLFREISRLYPDQAERVIFITGGAFTPSSREFLSSVANPCLEKPFRLDQLQAAIDERLGHFAERRHSWPSVGHGAAQT